MYSFEQYLIVEGHSDYARAVREAAEAVSALIRTE